MTNGVSEEPIEETATSHRGSTWALVWSLFPVTFYGVAESLRQLWKIAASPSAMEESVNDLVLGGLILLTALVGALVCIPVSMTFALRAINKGQPGRVASILALVFSSLGLIVLALAVMFVTTLIVTERITIN
jgi:hypothetical protein